MSLPELRPPSSPSVKACSRNNWKSGRSGARCSGKTLSPMPARFLSPPVAGVGKAVQRPLHAHRPRPGPLRYAAQLRHHRLARLPVQLDALHLDQLHAAADNPPLPVHQRQPVQPHIAQVLRGVRNRRRCAGRCSRRRNRRRVRGGRTRRVLARVHLSEPQHHFYGRSA